MVPRDPKSAKNHMTEGQNREARRALAAASADHLQIRLINTELENRGSRLRLRADGVRVWDPHYFTGNPYETLRDALEVIDRGGITPYRDGVAYGKPKYATPADREEFRSTYGRELPVAIGNPEIHKYLVPMGHQIGYVGGDREAPSTVLAINTEEYGLITAVAPTSEAALRAHESLVAAQAAD